jgi:hypothetical protein
MANKTNASHLTYFVDEDANHIGLSPLQGPECTAKVKLDIILFTLHAHAK